MKAFYLVSLLVASIQAQPFHPSSNLDSVNSGSKNDELRNFVRRSPQKSLSPSEIRAQYLRSGGGTPIPLSDDQADSIKSNSGLAGSSRAKAGVRSSGPDVSKIEDSSSKDSSMEDSSAEDSNIEDSVMEDSSMEDSSAGDSIMEDNSSESSGPSGLAAIPAGVASAAFNLVRNFFFARKN